MAHSEYTWADGSGGGTPIVATRLHALERAVSDLRWLVPSGMTPVDEFDDDAIGGSWVRADGTGAASGNATWTELGDCLSALNVGGDTAERFHALLIPISAMSVGDGFVTCLTAMTVPGTTYGMGGLVLSDTPTYGAGNQVMTLNYTSSTTGMQGVQFNETYQSANFTAVSGVSGPNTYAGAPTWIRLSLIAANTWRQDVSPNGVQWIPSATSVSKTMTPTHVGILSSSWGTATKSVISYECLRRVSGVS